MRGLGVGCEKVQHCPEYHVHAVTEECKIIASCMCSSFIRSHAVELITAGVC